VAYYGEEDLTASWDVEDLWANEEAGSVEEDCDEAVEDCQRV
jgi:hypothetical protein